MLFLLAYITVLLMLESLFVSVGTWTILDIYINNRNYPGGPWVYFLATQDLPENVIFFASLFVLTFLSDLLVVSNSHLFILKLKCSMFQLWRCWVIWTTSGKLVAYAVLALPTTVLLASFGDCSRLIAKGCADTILALGTIWTLQSSQPGLSLYNAVPIAFGTAYYVTSLSVNILVTVLIIFRFTLHRRVILDVLPAEYAKHYLSIATILVESAALYSIFALAFIVSYALNNPINQIFLTFATTSQVRGLYCRDSYLRLMLCLKQVAGYLIILRLAQGRAWRSDILARAEQEPQLPTIHYSLPVSTTQVESDQSLDIEAQGDHKRKQQKYDIFFYLSTACMSDYDFLLMPTQLMALE